MRDRVKLENIQILWENDQPAGYTLDTTDRSVMHISNMLQKMGVNPAEAVAAIASPSTTAYVRVTVSRPGEIASLRQAGYQVAHPDWYAFIVKPLVPEATVEEARRLYGIGTDQFSISWMDTT